MVSVLYTSCLTVPEETHWQVFYSQAAPGAYGLDLETHAESDSRSTRFRDESSFASGGGNVSCHLFHN